MAEAIRSAVGDRPDRAAVRLQLPRGLPPVAVDGTQLRLALTELVDHALRRCPAGTRVTISAAPEAAAGGRPAGVGIRVADRGGRLLGEARRGSLPQAPALRGLLAGPDARFAVQDTPGGGATCVLTLPAV
ncbi:hypothetical protein [Kitasatospora sp. NPDC057223]|uniref:hypothetical protein n=1 Tax=Kitasatospora sp. NPDC057223 TaxID=3346055 RepID=UPI003629A3A6